MLPVCRISNVSKAIESRKQLQRPLSDCESGQALPQVVNHSPTFLHDVHLQQLPDVLKEAGLLVCLLLLLLLLFLFFWFLNICTLECDLKSDFVKFQGNVNKTY